MRFGRVIWAAAVVAASACTDAGPAEPNDAIALDAGLYLHDAIDVMQFNSVRRYEIDWTAFREQAFSEAAGAQSLADTYPAIVAALERIGDGHSFFREPVTSAPPSQGDDPSAALFGEVGYVDVPAFSGGGADADTLAVQYHRLIEDIDTLGATCRWVVDLRGNTGGNMWPMVAGVGPILGEDTVGFFVDPDSVYKSWIYEAGEARIDDAPISRAEPAYVLESPRPHVAVLTDSLTASSGEAVAVAFRGRADTRSFGGMTWGVSTANAAFPLSDGAVIFLTVSTMVDRDRTIYGQELLPDESVVGPKTGDPQTDPVLDAAIQWLEGRACN